EIAHKQTVGDTCDEWWAKIARDILHWFRDFQAVIWFSEDQLNAYYNCLNRRALKNGHHPDEPNQHEFISYAKLPEQPCKLANIPLSPLANYIVITPFVDPSNAMAKRNIATVLFFGHLTVLFKTVKYSLPSRPLSHPTNSYLWAVNTSGTTT
ncbi:acetyl-coenzyme A synthetase 2, partial [Marasmius sp. AFHP31]